MNFVVQRGLIVDSSFASRQSLLHDLKETGFVETIVEARSFDDALQNLRTVAHDACLIGPSVTQAKAIDLIRTSQSYEKSRDCAFVAVLNANENRDLEPLIIAGAEILRRPYEKASFTALVQSAVRKAKKQVIFGEHGDWVPANKLSELTSQIEVAPRPNEIEQLASILFDGAAELRKVAQDVRGKQLNIRSDGSVSLATRDALRVAIEQLLGQSSAQEFGTFDHYFVHGIVDWFIDRTMVTQAEAAERLRRRLVSFQDPFQRPSSNASVVEAIKSK